MKLEDIELSDEQREAAVELSPEQLHFAILWLNRAKNGLAAWQCVAQAYPGHDSNNMGSCNSTAMRLINHDDKVRRFLNAMNRQALRQATYDTSMIAKVFQRQATTTEQKLEGVAEWRWVEGSRGKPVRRPWVPSMDVIKGDLIEVITGYEPCDTGGMYLEYRELCDAKTRQRAAELLGKMGAEFVERVEHSGRLDSITGTIDATDPVKATQDYMQLVKGLDAAGSKR